MCIKCEMLTEELRKERAKVAAYRHRQRVKTGKARHNLRYKGRPTMWARQQTPALADLIAKEPKILKVLQGLLH